MILSVYVPLDSVSGNLWGAQYTLGAMSRRIDTSYFLFQLVLTTGILKAMVRAILSVHIQYPLPLLETSSPCSIGSGFPLLPYVRRQITVNKTC